MILIFFSKYLLDNNYLSSETQIICIIGADKSQNNYYEKLKSKLGNKKVINLTPIRIKDNSKNAVDSVLSLYLGMSVSLSPSAEFVIISDDGGYFPVINRLTDIGVNVKGFKKTLSKKVKKIKLNEEKVNSTSKNKEALSDTEIEEIAKKIYEQTASRPKKVKSLKKRIGQYKLKYKFNKSALESIFGRVKEYLIEQKKILILNDKTIQWQ